jgi:hypothetical protein
MIGPKGEMKVTPSENLMILVFYHALLHGFFGILHFSVCTFCNYRFDKARKSHAFACINEVEDISVHCTLEVFVHVISKSRRFPVST